ncbi:MAG TPA: hypothetical protein VFO41_11645 [Alphaproteobacteria bacterium]|nr:hypothetical protein [Alphaproteobacteria bacterium]
MHDRFGDALHQAVHHVYRGDDAKQLVRLGAIADPLGVPLVATNDVLYHERRRRTLQDVLTCIRERFTIAEAGKRLSANAERHLKPAEEMARLFAARPEVVARTLEFVDRCRFSLAELRYEYPAELTGDDRA